MPQFTAKTLGRLLANVKRETLREGIKAAGLELFFVSPLDDRLDEILDMSIQVRNKVDKTAAFWAAGEPLDTEWWERLIVAFAREKKERGFHITEFYDKHLNTTTVVGWLLHRIKQFVTEEIDRSIVRLGAITSEGEPDALPTAGEHPLDNYLRTQLSKIWRDLMPIVLVRSGLAHSRVRTAISENPTATARLALDQAVEDITAAVAAAERTRALADGMQTELERYTT